MDNVSIATTAIGVMTGILLSPNETGNSIVRMVDGYIEFCDHVARISIAMETIHEQKYQGNDQSEPGVWNYEVAEPVGKLLAEHILAGNDYTEFDWKAHFIKLNNKFYNQ